MAVDPSPGPVVLVAFEGWPDAAHAATGAVEELLGDAPLSALPGVDPDDYFDLQIERPLQVLVPTPELVLPRPALGRIRVGGRDVVAVSSPEPTFRWLRFAAEVADAVQALSPPLVCLLGSFSAALPHTRPVRVVRAAWDEAQARRVGVPLSRYEGPVSVLAPLSQELARRGVPAVQLWAPVPNYLTDTFTPASLALLEAVADLTGLLLPLATLRSRAAEELLQHDAAVAESRQAADYVRRLETRHDARDDSEDLVEDIVAYLRAQSGEAG